MLRSPLRPPLTPPLRSPYEPVIGNAGGSPPAEALALFARMTTQPDAARKSAISSLIASLKASGVWAKLEVLQIYAAADSQAALLNWVSSNNAATAVNTPSFVADYGFITNGSSSYVNTGTNPASLTLSGLNDAFVMMSPLKARQNPITWALGSVDHSVLWASGGASWLGTINASSSGADSLVVAEIIHYMAADRSGASASKLYGREEISSTFSRAAATVPGRAFYLGARNLNGSADLFTAQDVGAFAYGQSLGDAGHAALQAALAGYMHTVQAWRRPLSCWGDSRTAGTSQTPYPAQILGSSNNRRITFNGGASGDTSTQIKARFLADAVRINKDWVPVFWAGYNNRTQVSTVLSDIAEMAAHCSAYYGGRYLVLNIPASRDASFYPGTTDGDAIASINASLASIYGSRLVDVCTPLYAGDPNSVMAAAYVINTSTDYIHCNTAGLALVASAVEAKAAAFGW